MKHEKNMRLQIITRHNDLFLSVSLSSSIIDSLSIADIVINNIMIYITNWPRSWDEVLEYPPKIKKNK